MANPLKDLIDTYKSGAQENKGLASEARAAGEMRKTNLSALRSPVAEPEKPKMPEKSEPVKLDPSRMYGTRPGEKRIDTSEMTKPLMGSFKQGGVVPKTGVYKMEKGEHVLTPEHKAHMKNALDLAESVLAHKGNPEADKPEMPAKEVKAIHIRWNADKSGHIIEHHHTMPHVHPMEEHSTMGTDHLVGHVMDHMTDPDEGEEAAEAGDHGMQDDGGKEAAEKAVGYK